MIVKNLNGTSNNPNCPSGSWLKHWENWTGRPVIGCSEISCKSLAKVGAHVQKRGGDDQSWYIIPLCTMHNNQRGQEVRINDSTPLAPAIDHSNCK